MSQPFSRYLHPFDIDRRPGLEPEVQRANLAAWASGRAASAPSQKTAIPSPPRRTASIDTLLNAFRGLDDPRVPGAAAP
ncbi:hypothetical protein [Brevundimonas sp. GCM10030266]|uniref:hypothetical protein n=1 Tax=Brevundimonas sp. GCM10030266 TaxID=3273386 RepID=UPI00362281C0